MYRNIRRVVQIILFLLFIYLLINTRYNDEDVITLPVDLFFKLDPLAMLVPLLSEGVILSGLYYALGLAFFTIFLGKFFCGWICPMGTTLDIFSRFYDSVHKKRKRYNFDFMKH